MYDEQVNDGRATFSSFQLDVEVDAKEKWAFSAKYDPKYSPQSKIANSAKRNMELGSVRRTRLSEASEDDWRQRKPVYYRTIHQQRTGTEYFQTSSLSTRGPSISLIHSNNRPGFLYPQRNSPSCISRFTRVHLDIEISTYWSLLSPHVGTARLTLPKTTGPEFSNLCITIMLHLPSNLQGSHTYDADLLVWPAQPNAKPSTTSKGL